MGGQVLWAPADARGVATLTLHNPGKHNALSVSMWQALRQHLEAAQSQVGEARVIIVRGADGHFASGGDIEEFPDFRFDETRLRHFHEAVVLPALHALLDCDLPLIAAIEGSCMGGGLEIAACCDLRIAARSSRLGIPIARLGFPMAPAEVEIVAAVTGSTLLREMLIDARPLSAEQAWARGVLTRVVDDLDLHDEVDRTADQICRLSPQAMRLNKQTLRRFAPTRTSSADERAASYAYADTPEHREGLAAFQQRRPARF